MDAPTLRLAQDPDADALLARDPLALLMGMLLDQQFPLEWAFRAPWRLAQRPTVARANREGRVRVHRVGGREGAGRDANTHRRRLRGQVPPLVGVEVRVLDGRNVELSRCCNGISPSS